jgi:hypothetical protein
MHSLNLIQRVAYSIATLALAFTAYTGIGVPSASAATGLAVRVSCESGGIGGVPHFVCDGYVTGGVPPDTAARTRSSRMDAGGAGRAGDRHP